MRLRGSAVQKRVRPRRMHADVERRLFALRAALFRERGNVAAGMRENRRNVVNVRAHLRRMIVRGDDFQLRRAARENSARRVELRVGAFVHRDAGFFQPALRLQMLSEIGQKRAPDGIEIRRSDVRRQRFPRSRRFVEIADFHRPREHRVAGNLFRDADVVHHEADPRVECGIVEFPRTVLRLRPFHHGLPVVEGLMTPRLFDDGTRDGFLPEVAQARHRRHKRLEMRLGPQRRSRPAGDGLRVLPQIEMNFPPLRRRERRRKHAQTQRRRFLSVRENGE